MPITLECYCPDNPYISKCAVTKLTLHVEVTTVELGATKAMVELAYGWNGARYGGVAAPDSTGTVEQDIDITAALDYWDSLYVEFGGAQSQSSGPDAGTVYKASWYVVIEYTCTNTATGEVIKNDVRSIDQEGGVDDCSGNGSMLSTVGRGAGVYQIWWARSLALDQDAKARGTNWQPSPMSDAVYGSRSSQLCLCPEGGTPLYTFSIVGGRLRDGEYLNESTGCIEGEPTGKDPGSYPITYRVTDATGQYAEVTCDYVADNCPARGPIGNYFA